MLGIDRGEDALGEDGAFGFQRRNARAGVLGVLGAGAHLGQKFGFGDDAPRERGESVGGLTVEAHLRAEAGDFGLENGEGDFLEIHGGMDEFDLGAKRRAIGRCQRTAAPAGRAALGAGDLRLKQTVDIARIVEQERLPHVALEAAAGVTALERLQRFGRRGLAEGFDLVLEGEQLLFLKIEEAHEAAHAFGRLGERGEAGDAFVTGVGGELVAVGREAGEQKTFVGELGPEGVELALLLSFGGDAFGYLGEGFFLARAGVAVAVGAQGEELFEVERAVAVGDVVGFKYCSLDFAQEAAGGAVRGAEFLDELLGEVARARAARGGVPFSRVLCDDGPGVRLTTGPFQGDFGFAQERARAVEEGTGVEPRRNGVAAGGDHFGERGFA